MTPKERILAALRGKPTDRLPYQEIFFNNYAVAEHFGGPQKSFDDAGRYLSKSGQCSMLVAGYWWSPCDVYAETQDGHKRYTGGRTWTMKDVREMQEPDIEPTLPSLQEGIEAARRYRLACHVFIQNGFHAASTIMGLENLCYTLVDAPEVLKAMIDRIEEYNRHVLQKLSSFDIDIVFVDGDCAYKNGLMVSPDIFRNIWFEPTRKTMELCRANGWPYCYHTDGKVKDLYPMLIELGFYAHHGVEAAANDLGEIKSLFGDRITLIGNFDVAQLALRRPEEITRLTRKMLDTGSPGGRYIAGCNTVVGEEIPLENYLAFQKTIMEYERHP
jgi:uroporphyrinogen-III decarboxylase